MSMHGDRRGSRIQGFHRLQRHERIARLAEHAGLSPAEVSDLLSSEALSFEAAEHMIENTVGVLGLPLGVGLNFLVNQRDWIVPMAIEEPSVIAAASYAARLIRDAGGFVASADPSLMIGQIQLVGVRDPRAAMRCLEAQAAELLAA